MKRIDLNQKNYLMFVDTETIGTLNVKESIMPFDISIKVVDLNNESIVYSKCYIVRKFFNNKYVMMSTFSATKYDKYLEKIETDKSYKITSVSEISKDIEKVVAKYNIDTMVAHNGEFDKEACGRLFEEFGVKNPFKKLDLLDTMEVSKVITFSSEYADFCLDNRNRVNKQKESCFITNSGRVRTTAQAIYCFITNNPMFEEEHTGLEDIDIEIEIFFNSIGRLGNLVFNLNTAPKWQDYSKVTFE